MGRRKGQASEMGKSIIRDRFRGKRDHVRGGSYLHTTDLNDGYDWGRLNLMSVTEQNSLEEFLATAELAGTEFAAEKLNVQIVTPQHTGLLSAEELLQVKNAHEKHKALLRIPRRPAWNKTTTAEVLDQMERDEFLNWRRGLASLQEEKHIVLTPYEKNLDFWRQLWRVIERSDIIVQIVDARNPLLFWCPDLDTYVKEVDSSKVTVILINKADFLTVEQRKVWANYFAERGVTVLFWSALEENKRHEEEKGLAKSKSDFPTKTDEPEEYEETDEGNEEAGTEEIDYCDSYPETDDVWIPEEETVRKPQQHKSPNPDNLLVQELEVKATDLNISATETYTAGKSVTKVCEGASDSVDKSRVEPFGAVEQKVGTAEQHISHEGDVYALKTGDQLLEMFREMSRTHYLAGVTTVGMVGYPNVGKSSTINAIMQCKKVPVSATPGRTKHFQTLYVDEDLVLCDCPGLVFPSFVTTKAELVVSGVLSIDQLRDHMAPTSLICQRISRSVLEATYSINLPPPLEGEDANRSPSAIELLTVYGHMRGFMTHKGNPDCPRSARYILKDYVNGKLLFCHPPPGIDAKEFQAQPAFVLDQLDASKKQTSLKSGKVPANSLDREFFSKMSVKAHAKGTNAVPDFVRKEGLRQIGAAQSGNQETGSASSASSQQALAGKPWKRHYNRNKKEKLRRVYAEHDRY